MKSTETELIHPVSIKQTQLYVTLPFDPNLVYGQLSW